MNVHEVAVRKLVSALRLFAFLLIDPEMPLAVLRDAVLFNELILRGGRRLVLAPVVSLVEHCVAGLDQLLRVRVSLLVQLHRVSVPAPVAFRPAPACPSDPSDHLGGPWCRSREY